MKPVNFIRKPVSLFAIVSITLLFSLWGNQSPAASSVPSAEKSLTTSVGNADDEKCADWSTPIDGVQFRYCKNEYATYYDILQWYNGNSYKVYVTWKWSVKDNNNDYSGKSKIDLDSGKTSPESAIADGYQVVSIKVEKK